MDENSSTTASGPAKDRPQPIADFTRRTYLVMVQPPVYEGQPLPKAVQAEMSTSEIEAAAELAQDRSDGECGVADAWINKLLRPLGLAVPSTWRFTIDIEHNLSETEGDDRVIETLRAAGFEADLIDSHRES